jgi:hypothetical protein
VVIEEAGGRISDPRGDGLALLPALGSRFDAIATNGQLHEEFLGLMEESSSEKGGPAQ